MSVPDWMPEPPAPGPGELLTNGWQVLDTRPGADGMMLVTFGFPDLSRVTISVPTTVWLQGQHLAIGTHLATLKNQPADSVGRVGNSGAVDPHQDDDDK